MEIIRKNRVARAHRGIVKRLKRAEGHLHQMIAMIEEDRLCLERAQRL